MMKMNTLLLIGDDFYDIENYQGKYSSDDPDYAEGAIEWKVNNLNVLSREEWGSVELMWGQLVWGMTSLLQQGYFEVSFSGRKLIFAQHGRVFKVSAGVQFPASNLIERDIFIRVFVEAALAFYENLNRIKGISGNITKEIEICKNLKISKV